MSGWWKNPKWLSLVRSLPCLSCGARRGIEAHHVDAFGMSAKNPDAMAIPLCGGPAGCHAAHHSRNQPTKEWCREALKDFWTVVTIAAGVSLHEDEAARKKMGERAYRVQFSEIMDGVMREMVSGGPGRQLAAAEAMMDGMRSWNVWRP